MYALECVNRALEIQSDFYHILDTKAYLLSNSENPENYPESLELYNRVILQVPAMYYIWSRANLYSKMGEVDKAEEDFKVVREKLSIIGFLDMTIGDVDKVINYFSSLNI